jgi:hypothetical protein
MKRDLWITVCVSKNCQWSHPTYIPRLVLHHEEWHTQHIPEHSTFKRLIVNTETMVPEVLPEP